MTRPLQRLNHALPALVATGAVLSGYAWIYYRESCVAVGRYREECEFWSDAYRQSLETLMAAAVLVAIIAAMGAGLTRLSSGKKTDFQRLAILWGICTAVVGFFATALVTKIVW